MPRIAKKTYVKKAIKRPVKKPYMKKRSTRYPKKFISNVWGGGDYHMPHFRVKANTLSNGASPPQFGFDGRKTIVRHREYIQDIYSAPNLVNNYTPFSPYVFSINVGLLSTFPWLASGIGSSYEQYVVKGMIFEFKSTSCDALNSTNTGLGTIIMATQYNSASANFVNKQQMENYEFAQSCKPSESMLHIIECARNETPITELYVRTGAVPTGQDQRLYDLGDFTIASIGQQAQNVNLGELWVTYEIELLKPKLILGEFGDDLLYAHYYASSGITTSAYFGTTPLPTASTNFFVTLTGTTITFPANITEGNYLINYSVIGSLGSPVGPTIAVTSGCTALKIYNNGANYQASQTASGNFVSQAYITITAGSAVCTLSSGTMPSSVTYMDLVITQIDGLAG